MTSGPKVEQAEKAVAPVDYARTAQIYKSTKDKAKAAIGLGSTIMTSGMGDRTTPNFGNIKQLGV